MPDRLTGWFASDFFVDTARAGPGHTLSLGVVSSRKTVYVQRLATAHLACVASRRAHEDTCVSVVKDGHDD